MKHRGQAGDQTKRVSECHTRAHTHLIGPQTQAVDNPTLADADAHTAPATENDGTWLRVLCQCYSCCRSTAPLLPFQLATVTVDAHPTDTHSRCSNLDPDAAHTETLPLLLLPLVQSRV